MLNNYMKLENIINTIYEEVKALGFVANQYEFSVMCGRTSAWFSTIKARHLSMTTDAFLTLRHNLKQRSESIEDQKTKDRVERLSIELIDHADTQIGRKLGRPFHCSLLDQNTCNCGKESS